MQEWNIRTLLSLRVWPFWEINRVQWKKWTLHVNMKYLSLNLSIWSCVYKGNDLQLTSIWFFFSGYMLFLAILNRNCNLLFIFTIVFVFCLFFVSIFIRLKSRIVASKMIIYKWPNRFDKITCIMYYVGQHIYQRLSGYHVISQLFVRQSFFERLFSGNNDL